MRKLLASCALVGALMIPGIASADIQPLQLGTSGPFDVFEDDANAASFGQYFTFTLDANTDVDIDINRTFADPDLVATLFSGDITGLDPNTISPDGLINGLLVTSGTFGPLTVVDFQDDTEDDPFGGPFGDPRFQINLNPGTYTVLVGAFNVDAPDGFTVTSNVGAVVPEPSSAGILGVLGAVAFLRRRRK